MNDMVEDYNPMKADSSYRMVINTSKSNFTLEGSYEDVLTNLKKQIKKNRKTSMVELEVTTLSSELSSHFKQELRKKSSIFVLVRFEKAVDENQAILGVLQDELSLITGDYSDAVTGTKDDKYNVIIQTSTGNAVYDGSYTEIIKKLTSEVRVNNLTSMVELDISTLKREKSTFFNQTFSKKTTILNLVRFETDIDEIEAIVGVLDTDLAFLNR